MVSDTISLVTVCPVCADRQVWVLPHILLGCSFSLDTNAKVFDMTQGPQGLPRRNEGTGRLEVEGLLSNYTLNYIQD